MRCHRAVAPQAVPPGLHLVDNEVAGLRGTAEGHMQLAAIFVDNAEGCVLLLASHIMIGSPVVSTRLAATRVLADFHCRLTVHAHAQNARVFAARIFGVDVGEDGVGFWDFFWGFALSTGRRR